jgi:hypothetical protein
MAGARRELWIQQPHHNLLILASLMDLKFGHTAPPIPGLAKRSPGPRNAIASCSWAPD